MSGPFTTQDAAFRRVSVLRQGGTWPGTVRYADGTWGLTYDPQDTSVTEEG